MLFYNPIYRISSFIIRIIVNRVNLPSFFSTIDSQIFVSSRELIKSQGLYSTLYVLYNINREIQLGGNINNILNNNNLNPVVVNTLLSIISPHWKNCIKYGYTINKNFKLYILGIVLSNFTKIFYNISKFIIGLILSSLGFIYSDLSISYPYLKELAYNFLNIIEDHSNLKFINKIDINNEIDKISTIDNHSINNHEDSINNNSKNGYNILSLLLLGLFGFGVLVVSIDYCKPHIFDGVVIVQPIVDTVYLIKDFMSSCFSGWYGNNDDPKFNPILKPEVLSRVSSNSSIGSDKTIVPSLPNVGDNPWE